LEDEIETWDLEGSPVDESPHWVGAAYLEKNLHSTLGLLTAILDPKAQEFHARCEKTFRRKIEHVPLIYPLLSKVERPPQEAMLFYSFEQCYHLQWEDERLVELSHVPKLEKTARENLIQDLFAEPMAVARLSHPKVEPETGDHSQRSDTESRSMADLVSGFHGSVNDPQKGFAWIPPSRKGSPRIWMVLIPLILSMTGFLYYWVERTDRHLESIHEERIKLQQQLEDQRKRVQESRAIQDQHAELEQAREQYAFQQQHRYRLLEALEQIFYSVEGAWIEQIRYHQNSISLNLFSEDPEVIPELLKRFSQSGKFEQVRLQSRSKIQIKGREVVRISLKMNIAPGKAKRNKNNE
jgi:Tfp pilus assembly protein PilN